MQDDNYSQPTLNAPKLPSISETIRKIINDHEIRDPIKRFKDPNDDELITTPKKSQHEQPDRMAEIDETTAFDRAAL